ncbi:alpha/beta-hydrolase [Rhizodiscina lignyota]|uniref:Alpha/beta-hydrolase n=1 Tax=Rhizodiscina lignyota TaxID=1504668 RepID=A0A9P4I9W6_9PEZI|nr:alpha/beta-hydrolase [Rhizodiscina lignyota]
MAPKTKPIILIVPGAWHAVEHYNPVIGLLQAAGYTVKGETMPSASEVPTQSFDADVALVRYEILNEIERSRDVLLLAHSFGGLIAGEASKGFTRKEREAMGREGCVVGIVYMAAFVLPVGGSVMSNMPGAAEPPWYGREGRLSWIVPNMEKVFYPDIDPEIARSFVERARPHSFRAMQSKVTYAAYEDYPTWYIWPVKDQGFAVKTLQQTASHHEKIYKVDAAHSPFVNHPDVVAKIVRGIAGEDLDLSDLETQV